MSDNYPKEFPPKPRPELPDGWAWEENKISTAWSKNAMCTMAAIGELECHGEVPDEVKHAVRAAREGCKGST